jgi:simple sugar transport system substrate-binding protein
MLASRKRWWTVLLLLGSLVASTPQLAQSSTQQLAQTSGDQGSLSNTIVGLKRASDVKIIYVSCAGDDNPFTLRVNSGARLAGENLGVQLQVIWPDKVDITQLNQKIDEAIAAQPDGIAFCGLDPHGSASEVQRANDSGIAVAISPPANSVLETPLRDPALGYIGAAGSDEPSGGLLAAKTLIDRSGVKSLVCTQSQVDTTQAARCNAAEQYAKSHGATLAHQIVPDNEGQAADVMTNVFRAQPDIDAVICTNNSVAAGVVEAKQAAGSSAHVAAFDLNTNDLAAVKQGTMDFVVDQQEFWRGYVPVMLLAHNIEFGMLMANNFLTGPSIVDQSNVDAVTKLVALNIR